MSALARGGARRSSTAPWGRRSSRAGSRRGVLPEEWILARPEEIARVHAEHAAAGARILLTCTFSCAAPRLEVRVGPARIPALCGSAERLARSASRGGLVAGALGPDRAVAAARPGRLAGRARRPLRAARSLALAAAGVELLWIESQHDLGEARAALAAARATGLPVVVTFTLEERGRPPARAGRGGPARVAPAPSRRKERPRRG